jgi:hypothetical protein
MPGIFRAQQTAEQLAYLHRLKNVDYIPFKDIWGIPQLPPTP